MLCATISLPVPLSPRNQHGRVRPRVALHERAHALHGFRRADHIFQAVTRAELLHALTRAQRAVQSFDRARFLKRQHRARRLRRRSQAARDARRSSRRARCRTASPSESGKLPAQIRREFEQRAARCIRGVDAEHGGKTLVHRLDASLGVERDDAVAQVLQQIIEPLTAYRFRAASPARLRAPCLPKPARTESREYRNTAPMPACRGEIGDESGADDHVDAAIARVQHDAFGVLRGLMRGERHVEPERRDEAAHFVGRVAVRDQRDLAPSRRARRAALR